MSDNEPQTQSGAIAVNDAQLTGARVVTAIAAIVLLQNRSGTTL